jgi:RimJ/RimL family protein N-acetyltransferase
MKCRNDNNSRRLCEPCKKLIEQSQPTAILPLNRDDLELVLAWRSNPEIYRYFRQQDGPLDWDEHVKWFESRSPERYDFVTHYDGRRVGVISLDASNRVSIYIGDFSAHNQGVATNTLNWLCDRFEDRTPLIAEIYKSNTSSKQLFTQCGFQQQGCKGQWLQYVYDS